MRLLILIVFLLFSPITIVAEEISQDKAIANYLYNFANYIEWGSSINGSFAIHIVSSDAALERNIKKTLAGQKLKGKNIEITRSATASVPSGAQMVFVGKGSANLYQQTFRHVEGKRMLLVSHGYANKRLVMINLTDSSDGKLRFEINKANILNQGLEIDPKIILLGGTELDVAQLYKSTKDTLVHKEEELSATKERVATLDKEIKAREAQLEVTRKKTEQYKSEADALKKSLELQKDELAKERAKLALVQTSLDETNKKFEKAELDFKKQKEEIGKREVVLSELAAQIQKKKGRLEELEKSVKEQDALLEARDATISHQRTYIWIVSAFATVFLFFIAVIAFILRREHRTNVKLLDAQAAMVSQAKMAQMGEMLTMIAHHWRQPLNRIGVIIQNIKDDYHYGEMEEEKLQKGTDDVMEILNDISSTINRFSGAVAKSERKRSFDPCEEVENILNLFRPEFKSYFISVEVKAIQGITLFGDPIQFGEVFSSLLKNAEEALIYKKEEDGERNIVVEFEQHHKSLEIGVWDNGDPIPEEFLSRIFEPFFTTKGIAKKTGLGLYSAKLVIEQQFMGTIKVVNMENGVKCIIEIPIKDV